MLFNKTSFIENIEIWQSYGQIGVIFTRRAFFRALHKGP